MDENNRNQKIKKKKSINSFLRNKFLKKKKKNLKKKKIIAQAHTQMHIFPCINQIRVTFIRLLSFYTDN